MGEIVAECIHGLTSAWCSPCKDKPTKTTRANKSWVDHASVQELAHPPYVRARFESECIWCQDEIEVGDFVYMREGVWVCGECGAAYDRTNLNPNGDDAS